MHFDSAISTAGYAVETLGVLVIILGSCIASIIFLKRLKNLPEDNTHTPLRQYEGNVYRHYRRHLGRSIILGLEFLIAGDIIRTVVISDTIENVAVLGLIILIRSFLSIELHLEVEGQWPWSTEKQVDNSSP